MSLSSPFKKEHFNNGFDRNDISYTKKRLIHFEDTIPNDTLYICFTSDSILHAIYREILTTVCVKGECLPVRIMLYWSPGGDYLGYSLEDEYILTKYKHKLFTKDNYLQLHLLLSDSQSLLKNYSLDKLINTDKNKVSTDAVSGATIPAIRNYVVDGAVYTTFTLWHISHGVTADSVRSISSRYFSKGLLNNLLSSNLVEDKLFALSYLNRVDTATIHDLIPKLERLILSSEYTIQNKAINALNLTALPYPKIQKVLVGLFHKSDFGTKQLLLSSLKAYEKLDSVSIEVLTSDITTQSSIIVKRILDLLKDQSKISKESELEISKLLNNSNRFIANSAYQFLTVRQNSQTLK